jgi:hypothetical protein
LNTIEFSRVIFEIIDFPHSIDVDIARFLKNTKKIKKFQNLQKKKEKRKLRDQF